MINPLRLFTKTEYAVAYRFSDKDILSDLKTPFLVLKPNKEFWYADPFIYKKDGEYYVFMEMMHKDKDYAGLGYSKLVDGKLTEPKLVIDPGYHFSFPIPMERDGVLYMVPETSYRNRIKYFVCESFPEKWKETSMFIEGPYYDSVPFCYEGQEYIFSSKGSSDGLYGSQLFLLNVSMKDGAVTVEKERALTKDNLFSRNGGCMLESDGKLYRVAQDCSDSDYGRALTFMQVDALTPDDYQETFVRRILPKEIPVKNRVRGRSGVHTYNRVDNFEVVDFKLCTFSLKCTFLKIKIVFEMILNKLFKKS